LASPRNWGKI